MYNQIPPIKKPAQDDQPVVGAVMMSAKTAPQPEDIIAMSREAAKVPEGAALIRCITDINGNPEYQLWIRQDLIDLAALISSDGTTVEFRKLGEVTRKDTKDFSTGEKPRSKKLHTLSRSPNIEDSQQSWQAGYLSPHMSEFHVGMVEELYKHELSRKLVTDAPFVWNIEDDGTSTMVWGNLHKLSTGDTNERVLLISYSPNPPRTIEQIKVNWMGSFIVPLAQQSQSRNISNVTMACNHINSVLMHNQEFVCD